ncbi:hypothetical protein U1Q18_011454, partial [Sarracenia purpurea var. burkii]
AKGLPKPRWRNKINLHVIDMEEMNSICTWLTKTTVELVQPTWRTIQAKKQSNRWRRACSTNVEKYPGQKTEQYPGKKQSNIQAKKPMSNQSKRWVLSSGTSNENNETLLQSQRLGEKMAYAVRSGLEAATSE